MFGVVREQMMGLLADDMGELSMDTSSSEMDCYRVAQSPEVGRHIVATRKLNKGEMVFRDCPIVTGPSRESEPNCIACYKPLDLEVESSGVGLRPRDTGGPSPYVLCPRCKWPLCSVACINSARHQPECSFLSQSGVVINAEDTDALYDVVTVLRCLYLRDNNTTAWADLLSLQEANPKDMDEELAERAKKVTGFICGTLKLGDTFSKTLVFDVCTRLDVNSFEIPLGRDLGGVQVQGVFTVACMVEHCCIPTGHRTFNADMSITVRSAYGSEEGDSVSLCYTDSLWPTAARREHLMYSKNFLCTCDRCQDETENETFISAIKCTKCPPGYFLPKNPIDCESAWFCNECKSQAPPTYNEMANSKTAEALAKLEEQGLTPDSCEKFLKTYGRVLHQNHAHMLDIKYSLLNILGHSEGFSMTQLTETQLVMKETLARNFLTIAQKILPGVSRLKGTALYELYLTIQQRAVRAINDPRLQLQPSEVLEMLETAQDHLTECIACLKYEPLHQPEGALYRRAKEEQNQLATLTASIKNQMPPA